MWMRRRTVRIEVEQVSLRIDGHLPPLPEEPSAAPEAPALDVLDRFLQLRFLQQQRQRALSKTHSASDREGSK